MSHLAYPLRDGFVANWLVAGPRVSPEQLDWDDEPGIKGTPVERGPIGTGDYQTGSHSGVWAYSACPEDNAVDHSDRYPPGHHVRSWAYAELVAEAAHTVAVELTATGPAGLWLDGALALRVEGGSAGVEVRLTEGAHQVLVRFDAVAVGQTPHAAALRVESDGIQVRIPTLIEDIGRRSAFEELTAGTFLERDVSEGGTPIVLHWPDGERAFCSAHVRLHGPGDAIYALADTAGQPGDAVQLGHAMQLPPGPMRVTLMPSPDEVYIHHTRITHHLPFWSLGRQRYAARPATSNLEARRHEALLAIAEHADSVYGQIARMALGAWQDVDASVITRAGEQADEATLLALVGLLHRYGTRDELDAGALRAAEDAVFSYDRWSDPGPEPSRILRHAVETLAGQLALHRIFADGQRGAWHREHGERLALAWMSAFAGRGSAQPGAAHVIEQEATALAALADLAESEPVYELAAVCLDKLLFLLALHSRQGVLGAASPSALASFVKSGLLQSTAPISRLLWGTGIYNHHLAGVLSLALATNYEPPVILDAIAHDTQDALWSQERHAPAGVAPVCLNTYRTPDYVLSSLADLRPGQAGASELTWRATLSPEAVVFVNQPGSSSESDGRMPGFWAGNARLPQVGQWRDALIALHRVADTDRLAFTHAYFPCATVDEHALRDGWAFARVGDGYLEITSSAGIVLTQEGRYALRELRSFGPAQAWLVQMGRAALDGDFAVFQAKVLSTRYACTSDEVRWTTMRGDKLRLSWDESLRVNGTPQSLAEGLHLDNTYTTAELPCTGIDIRLDDDVLRLDFMTC